MPNSIVIKCFFTNRKNNSLEIKAFPFRGSKIPPTLQQLKDLIRYSCHQMVNYDDDFELMYLGKPFLFPLVIVIN